MSDSHVGSSQIVCAKTCLPSENFGERQNETYHIKYALGIKITKVVY